MNASWTDLLQQSNKAPTCVRLAGSLDNAPELGGGFWCYRVRKWGSIREGKLSVWSWLFFSSGKCFPKCRVTPRQYQTYAQTWLVQKNNSNLNVADVIALNFLGIVRGIGGSVLGVLLGVHHRQHNSGEVLYTRAHLFDR